MTSFTDSKSNRLDLPLIEDVLFNADLALPIMSFLDATSLMSLSETCSQMEKLQQHPGMACIWLYNATLVWKTFSYNYPCIIHSDNMNEDSYSNFDLLRRINKISLSDLKKCLHQVDLSRCVEKQDYQRMLMAHIVLVNPYVNRASSAAFRKSLPISYRGGRYYPDWCLTMNHYKMSYVFNRIDSKRTEINESELCDINWYFQFKNLAYSDGIEIWDCKFYRDHSMMTTLHGEYINWQFVVTTNNVRVVQCEQYPPLTASRTKNGLWRMENSYVFIHQKESLDGNCLPLF